ncbi:MAG: heavy-metal-associated domain-containing protein [Bacteroidota bacterium]
MDSYKKKLAFVFLLFIGLTVYSQKTDTLEILTSSQCGMCKDRIEKAMAYERGVTEFELGLSDKILRVVYKPRRTNPDKIRKAVSDIGYDADDVKADERAYSKLPACCKKPDDPDYKIMDEGGLH